MILKVETNRNFITYRDVDSYVYDDIFLKINSKKYGNILIKVNEIKSILERKDENGKN